MKSKISKNQLDILSHTLLFCGGVLAVVVFLKLRFDQRQIFVIFGLVIFYLLWGLVYHFAKGDLSKKLALEYGLIGAICTLVGVLVFSL